MNAKSVIEARDVHVSYRAPRVRARSLRDFVPDAVRGRVRYDEIPALAGVSLAVGEGDVVGVVGHNGAGKSTLLAVLGSLIPPTRGSVIVHGSRAALIDPGAGFDMESSAWENTVLLGSLLGTRVATMREKADELLEWAGISAYSDLPLTACSSGMLARLAFAIHTAFTPDILLVDEIMEVGDRTFGARSRERLLDLAASGSAVVLVSHSPVQIEAVANRAVWLQQGRVAMSGDVQEVLAAYAAAPATSTAGIPPRPAE